MTIKPSLNLLKTYERTRSITIFINGQALELLDRKDYLGVGKKLRILGEDALIFNSESDEHVMWDYMMYHHRVNNLNTINRYALTIKTELSSFEKQVLAAMCKATFSIFEIKETFSHGGVIVQDIFNQKIHFLIDKSMSMINVIENRIFMGSHLIHFQNFSITSGAAMLVTQSLFREVKPYMALFLEKYNHFDNAPINALDKIVTQFVKCALRTDSLERTQYL